MPPQGNSSQTAASRRMRASPRLSGRLDEDQLQEQGRKRMSRLPEIQGHWQLMGGARGSVARGKNSRGTRQCRNGYAYALNTKRLKELGAPNVDSFFKGYVNER